MSHDIALELDEFRPLQWLRHEISDHLVGGAVLDTDVPLGNLVGKEKIADVQMSRTFPAAALSILLQKYGALVILKQDVFRYPLTLLRF